MSAVLDSAETRYLMYQTQEQNRTYILPQATGINEAFGCSSCECEINLSCSQHQSLNTKEEG